MARLIASSYAYHGKTAKTPTPPSHIAYDFVDWEPDTYKNVTENQNIYTVYRLKTFYVRFVYNGVQQGDAVCVNYGGTATGPIMPEVYGYNFIWNPAVNVTRDMTVTGDYYAASGYYDVVFYNDTGDVLKPAQRVAYGSAAVPPQDPSKDGYMFTGWNPSYTNIQRDTACYATYEKLTTSFVIKGVNKLVSGTANNGISQEFDVSTLPNGSLNIISYDAKATGVKKGNYLSPFDTLQFTYITQIIDTSNWSQHITSIGDKCFKYGGTAASSGYKSLGYVNYAVLPYVTHVGESAFYQNKWLGTFQAPNLRTCGQQAFYAAAQKSTLILNLPELTDIPYKMCTSAHGLMQIIAPKAKSIGEQAFNACRGLTTARFDSATSIGDSAFRHCVALQEIHFPNVESVGDSAFRAHTGNGIVYATGVTELYLPKLSSVVGTDAFTLFNSVVKLTVPAAMKSHSGVKKLWGLGKYDPSTDTAKNTSGGSMTIIWV